MSELKERYVATVLNSIPEKRRSDVDRELRAAIEDAIEAKVEGGEDPTAAETTVLTGLGDPALLAADYSDRPLYLIGPRFYLPWLRVMRKLLAVIPLLAGALVVLIDLLTGGSLGGAIVGGVWAGFIAAVNVAVWTTFGFAVAERDGAATVDDLELGWAEWSLDQLPRVPDRQFHLGEVVGSMVVIAVVFILLFNIRNVDLSFVKSDAWEVGIPVLLVLVALSFMVELVKLRARRWSHPLATANAAPNLGFAGWWTWALSGGLIVKDELSDAWMLTIWVTLAAIVAMCLWEAYKGFAGARQRT